VTPDQFIAKWKSAELTERAAAQSHFIDLCHMLGEPTPSDADPKGEWYAFEKGATKTTGGEGWADVWKRDHFGWEYKGKRKDLDTAFAQLQQYALALENPPLLVVCDMDRFRIHTNWTNSISQVHSFGLEQLRDANVREKLKWVFTDPERLKPGKTRQALTEEAAAEFAKLAQRLRDRGHNPETVAHFINRLVFCMFAEDVNLLPNGMFKRMLEHAAASPEQFHELARDLFKAMQSGGRIGFEQVAWFNGGLFNDDTALPLDAEGVKIALSAARLDWAEVDPSILGTLFERGLDPDKRSQLGAHYTDRDKIMMIVDPVIVRPWLTDWERAKTNISMAMEKSRTAKSPSARTKTRDGAMAAYRAFLDRLRGFRVLDPACGSGNFLYLALLALKDIEHRVSIEAEALGLQREFPQIGPASVKGIEINPYAAELARVSVWIGEIQWMRRNGFGVSDRPILKPLDNIECRDAILNHDGTEAAWPAANVIIGNPPFLGAKEMRGAFPNDYLSQLRAAYEGKVAGQCDLVMYWFYRAGEILKAGSSSAAGLVATNKIRKGANHKLLSSIAETARVGNAWSDLPWVVEGAAVRVSIVCIDVNNYMGSSVYLDGNAEHFIRTELVKSEKNVVVTIGILPENKGAAFVGGQKDGPFDIPRDVAASLLRAPLNPNGRSNADVVRPWFNGMDLARRSSETWIIDFGERTLQEAQLYEAPFAHVEKHVAPLRANNNDKHRRTFWWQHGRPASRAKNALGKRERMIVTPLTSKHRWFLIVSSTHFPDNSVVIIARDDLTTFGILSSSYHATWAERRGNFMGVGNDPRYTPSTTFDTFPFPEVAIPNAAVSPGTNLKHASDIAEAAGRLNTLRENWLNPPDLVKREPDLMNGLPDRVVPVSDDALTILKQRTMTNLYNAEPAWLKAAQREIDAAVAAAYGWPADITEEDALARLFRLNQERVASKDAA
jgi:type II restriction/modification system DNA methylase subunit YeeA